MKTNTHTFHCTLQGRGGHGAMPHETMDPIAAAAWLIPLLEDAAAAQGAAICWQQVHGGSRFNIIPEQLRLQGVLRTGPHTAAGCEEQLGRAARLAAQALRVHCSLQFEGEGH